MYLYHTLPHGITKRQNMKKIKITNALACFFENTGHLAEFFYYIIFTTKRVDEMRISAVKALAQINEQEPANEELKHVATDKLKKYLNLILELWLCRLVESYENYLSSVLKDVFLCCPQILKSSETVKLDEVLKYNTMDDFVTELTEKKINELSYSSFDDLFDFFNKKLGMQIIDNDADKTLIKEAIEIRNISVHNDCVINRRYIKKLDLDENLIGTRRQIKAEYLSHIIDVLYNNVIKLDSRLIKKFDIKNCKSVKSDFFTHVVEQKADKTSI